MASNGSSDDITKCMIDAYTETSVLITLWCIIMLYDAYDAL